MTELADPTFLDDRLAHWAEATPDGEAFTYLGRTLDVVAVGRARTTPRRRARRPRASVAATWSRSSTRTTPPASS